MMNSRLPTSVIQAITRNAPLNPMVVIDCPPSLGAAIISSVCAADVIVIPVGSDVFSFRGLVLTLNEIESICDAFGLKKPVLRVLFTRYDRREKLSMAAWEDLKRDYGELVLPNYIRTSTQYGRFLAKYETIFASRRQSPARQDYAACYTQLMGLFNQ